MIIYSKLKTTRRLRKRVPLVDTRAADPHSGISGFSSIDDGEEELTYQVGLDFATLAVMAQKAGGRKSNKCVCGPITVKIIGRKRL